MSEVVKTEQSTATGYYHWGGLRYGDKHVKLQKLSNTKANLKVKHFALYRALGRADFIRQKLAEIPDTPEAIKEELDKSVDYYLSGGCGFNDNKPRFQVSIRLSKDDHQKYLDCGGTRWLIRLLETSGCTNGKILGHFEESPFKGDELHQAVINEHLDSLGLQEYK